MNKIGDVIAKRRKEAGKTGKITKYRWAAIRGIVTIQTTVVSTLMALA